jgi:hypothetical protein
MNTWNKYTDSMSGRRGLWLGLAAAVTIAAAFYGAGVDFSSDPSEYFPREREEVSFWLDMTRRFDGMNLLMVGLEEPAEPLSQEGLRALDAVTKALSERKAEGVLWVRSLTNVDSLREGEDGTLNAELLVSKIPSDSAGLEALRAKVAADPQVSGALISRDMKGYIILVRADQRKDGREVARSVQKTVEARRSPLSAYYFGAPFFSNIITSRIYYKLPLIIPVFLVLLLVPLIKRIRSFSIVSLSIAAGGIPVVWWLGAMHLSGLRLTATSANAALFLAVIGASLFGRCASGRSAGGGGVPMPPALPVGLAAFSGVFLVVSKGSIQYLSQFFVAMSVGLAVMTLFSLAAFIPMLALIRQGAGMPAAPEKGTPPLAAGIAAALLLAAGAYWAWDLKFNVAPQEIFSRNDEIGRGLAFFDRRFGGTDFVQISVRGDFRDPGNAARIMRFTDEIETCGLFADTRSFTQVLAFLGQGFGGSYRIPVSRDALSNLWFFLEGSADIRPMINDPRTEAMIALRVPSRPQKTPAELRRFIEESIARSQDTGQLSFSRRIDMVARRHGVELDRNAVETAVATASTAQDPEALERHKEAVLLRLEAWLNSPDSPIAPDEYRMQAVRMAVRKWADVRATLRRSMALGPSAPADSTGMADTVAMRAYELMTAVRSQEIMDTLLSGSTGGGDLLRLRLKGIFSEIISPPAYDGRDLQFRVSGFPMLVSGISDQLKAGLFIACILLVVSATAAILVIGNGAAAAAGAGFEALLSATLALAVMRVLRIQIDSSSAILALLAPVSSFFLSRRISWGGPAGAGNTGYARALVLGFSLSGLSLLISGIMPAIRIGLMMAVSLFTANAVTLHSWRTGDRVTNSPPS